MFNRPFYSCVPTAVVTLPLNGSEAGVDLVLIQTSLLLACKCTKFALEQLGLHNIKKQRCLNQYKATSSLAAIQRASH